MKRVLIFSTAYFPFVGGAEVAVKEITDRLPDYEFEMVTALLDKKLPRQEKIGAIMVHRVGWGVRWFDKFYLALFGHYKAMSLHRQAPFAKAWTIMASYNGFTALNFKRLSQVGYLLTLQEGDTKAHIYSRVWWCWLYFKQIFSAATALQPISHYLLDWGKEMGFAGKVAAVIPNGVNMGRFVLADEEQRIEYRQRLRVQHHLPDNAKIIITASRLVKKNGVKDIIEALMFLPSTVYLAIAGTGKLEAKLKSMVKKNHLEQRVLFLGQVGHRELPELLWGSNVFCRPSLSEGLGNAFLEAMAAGLPVVATRVGGIPDFLTDGETGLFVQTGNPQDVAAKIQTILTDEKLMKHLVVRAMARVKERYSWERVAAQMREVL